jgi:hypothetical protein
MATLVLGSIVTYKNDHYVALGYDGNLVTIIAPHKSQRKLRVKRGNVTVVDASPLIQVVHTTGDYLVRLRSELIISLTTNRVMNWPDDNGNRREILRKAVDPSHATSWLSFYRRHVKA